MELQSTSAHTCKGRQTSIVTDIYNTTSAGKATTTAAACCCLRYTEMRIKEALTAVLGQQDLTAINSAAHYKK